MLKQLLEKLKQLRESRDEKSTKLKAIGALVLKEARDFKDDEIKENETLIKDIQGIDVQIDAVQKQVAAAQEDIKSKMTDVSPTVFDTGGGEKKEIGKVLSSYSVVKALRSHVDSKPQEGLEKEMQTQAESEFRDLGKSVGGVGIPAMFVQKASAGISTGIGGDTIATNLSSELIGPLRPQLHVEKLGATVMAGLTSNVDIARMTDLLNAAWEGEFTTAQETEIKTGTLSIKPKRMASYTVIGKQLLLQSSHDVEGWVRNELVNGHSRLLDSTYINGFANGNISIDGLMTLGGTNIIEADPTNGGALTEALVIDMETAIAVENADLGSMAYLSTPGLRGKAKKIIVDNGTNVRLYHDGKLNEYALHATTQVPNDLTKGSDADKLHALIFGVFSTSIIAHFGGYDLTVDPYTLADKAQIKIVNNAYHDIAFRYAKAFSVCKDIDITKNPTP